MTELIQDLDVVCGHRVDPITPGQREEPRLIDNVHIDVDFSCLIVSGTKTAHKGFQLSCTLNNERGMTTFVKSYCLNHWTDSCSKDSLRFTVTD